MKDAAMTGNQIVRLTRDMRPNGRAGDDVVLPAAVAAELIEKGDAEDPRPFPPADVAPAVPTGKDGRPQLTLRRPRPYFTRKKG
jgi:hypothetical protein